jgi:integrase
VWVPELARPAKDPATPTFHEFASEWLEARRSELRPASIADYSWQLCNHLLPFVHRHRLPQITVAEVDRYREFKVREGLLGAESINKTITRLGQILAVAEERDLITRNPVRVNTRNRKLKTKRRRPVFLDSAEQIVAMIDAATELDAKPEARSAGRRALVATLIYAGLRIGEATALRWREVDLAMGRISVGDSKTETGIRLVDVLPALRDELTSHRHDAATARPDDLVFPTSSGSRRDKDNARERVIRPVVAAADELLARRGHAPLPDGVTAHKLRHTFASILYVRGDDPAYVMSQLGHTDAGFTLRVYAHAMRRDEGDKERLKALVEGRDWAPLGTNAPSEQPQTEAHQRPRKRRNPRNCGDFGGWARRVSNLRPLACETRYRSSGSARRSAFRGCSSPRRTAVHRAMSVDLRQFGSGAHSSHAGLSSIDGSDLRTARSAPSSDVNARRLAQAPSLGQ